MFSFLKNHPFAVEAFFENSTVLSFAVPKEALQRFIPECLELDIFADKFAFIAVAMVKTKYLRPKGLPRFFGNNFFLIGYRIFVRYTNSEGKRVRGLYIIRSETDKKKMEIFGNIFTHYDYATTDISQSETDAVKVIKSDKSDFFVEIEKTSGEPNLPKNSPFQNLKEARRFAGPLPFTFTYDETKKEVLIIEGVRENWTPKPINIRSYKIGLLESFNLKNAVLANAFVIENVPYHWKKGKIDKWKPKENNFKA